MSGVNGQRVLVTGGAGFVGSTLVRLLVDRGAAVRVLDNLMHGRREHLAELDGRIQLVECDILDEDALDHAFSDFRPQRVYHAVGDTFVPTAYELPRRFFRINVDGTLNVLLAAKRWQTPRVLYVSSTEVYGSGEKQPTDETAPLNPANTYAVTKLAADRLCYTFAKEHGLPVVIARIFNTFGPRETLPYVIPEIIRQLARGPILQLGNAEARRDFTFVEDTAAGLMSLMESDLPDGEAFNIGSGHAHSIREVAALSARLLGVDSHSIETDGRRLRRFDVDEFRADSTRLRRATGWAPRVPFDDGMRRTIEWFRGNGSRWAYEDWCPDGVVDANRFASLER